MSVILAATAAGLFGIGTYLVLQRKLSRIIVGLGLVTHGANVLLLGSGRRGTPPLIGSGDPDGFSDPLPQALALTAIVISFGVTALLLALAYRSYLLTDDDEVEDDLADRAVARAALRDKEISDQEAFAIPTPEEAASSEFDDDDSPPDPGRGSKPEPAAPGEGGVS